MFWRQKILVGLLLIFALGGKAEVLSPGKYPGVVLFDRWDSCILCGRGMLYVSEKVKETLRPYSGKSIWVGVQKIYQPHNPGPGRMDQLKYLGPAVGCNKDFPRSGIRMASYFVAAGQGEVRMTTEIRNVGPVPVKIFGGNLFITLLTKNPPLFRGMVVTDGLSHGVSGRYDYTKRETRRGRQGGYGIEYSWELDPECIVQHDFILKPKTNWDFKIKLKLPDGQYDFCCCYAPDVFSEETVVGNQVGFDIVDGKIISAHQTAGR